MADNDKHTGRESPTTAKEPDFDEDAHETAVVSAEASQPTPAAPSPAPKKVSFQEDERDEQAPPPKPPRPMSPQAQAEATLIEAFPSIDGKVIKAVLVASGGRVEPAFNALLGMSDPDAHVEEPAPPPRPPRPSQAQQQLDADERYARKLAAQYEASAHRGGYDSEERGPPLPRRRQQGDDLYSDDREHSFFDDDLPRIQKNIQEGFVNTQKTVNKWISDFKKRIDGDDDEQDFGGTSRQGGYQRQNFGPSQSEQLYGIRKSGEGRRSGDRERYDADPHVLSDDFTQLELRDDEATSPQHTTRSRPLANPDLFKPTPVAPQSGPVDEVDALYRDDRPSNVGANTAGKPGGSAGSGKKWQPLTSVAPNPEAEDNDPFSLGDSDEEDTKKQDINPEDTERLKKAASEKEKNSTTTGKLQPAERSGSIGQKNEEAEKLLAGKS